MRLNLLAGFASTAWSALVMLVVVPIYLKFIGTEAYGLIGFFALLQSLLQLLDMGISPTINREVARSSATGSLLDAGSLLHTLAILCWSVAALIALLMMALSPLIAEYWLEPKHISQQTIIQAVMLMGLVVACRWPIGLYQGALIGAQRLAISSAINIVMVTLGSVGAAAVLAYVSPTIEAFFIWQACVGFAHALVIRWAAWRIIGRLGSLRFNINELKQIWRFSAGISAITITSLAFTQLDKAILSKMLGLEQFGNYMIATLLVSGLYMLITPAFNVIYPRFAAIIAIGDNEKLIETYRFGTRLLAAVLFPIAMVLAVFGESIVQVWTGNPVIALSTAPVMALLAIGSALNGVMYFPYALQLAYGKTWMPLTINVISLIFQFPLIIYLVKIHGAVGGAFAWLILEILYLIFGSWFTHLYLLRGLALKWVLQDVGVPMALSLIAGVMAHNVTHGYIFPPYVKLGFGVGFALMACLMTFLFSSELRIFARNFIENRNYFVSIDGSNRLPGKNENI